MDPDDARRSRFTRLYEDHGVAILGYALRRVTITGDAADVVAETFLVAWRRLDDVPVDNARLWLYGVARRVLANHRRGAVRRNRLADRLRADLAGRPPVVDAVDADPLATRALETALAKLSPTDREIVQLTAWEALTPTEAAAVLGIPPATARTRLHRARGRLLAELDRTGPDPTGERSPAAGHVRGDEQPLVPDREDDR